MAFSTFPDYMDHVRPRVAQAFVLELKELLADFGQGAELIPSLESGKKIRACLACLVCESLGGKLEAALPAAVALEIIQAASLIHDDFIDQDACRHGMPAVWKQVGARRAVLLGDLLFAFAIRRLSELGREEVGIGASAISLLSRGAAREPLDPKIVAGKIKTKAFDGGLYLKTIRLKTGTLFDAACRLGALAAGSPARLQEAAGVCGLRIGEIYQLVDDSHDIEDLLSGPGIRLLRLACLAPLLLCFGDGEGASLAAVLDGPDGTALSPSLRRGCSNVLLRMRQEIRERLASAADPLIRHLPAGDYRYLIRRAPGDVMAMFNRADSRLACADNGTSAHRVEIDPDLPEPG